MMLLKPTAGRSETEEAMVMGFLGFIKQICPQKVLKAWRKCEGLGRGINFLHTRLVFKGSQNPRVGGGLNCTLSEFGLWKSLEGGSKEG